MSERRPIFHARFSRSSEFYTQTNVKSTNSLIGNRHEVLINVYGCDISNGIHETNPLHRVDYCKSSSLGVKLSLFSEFFPLFRVITSNNR